MSWVDQKFDAESDDEDFNPVSHVDDDEEDVRHNSRSKGSSKQSRRRSPDNDEEDEDEDGNRAGGDDDDGELEIVDDDDEEEAKDDDDDDDEDEDEDEEVVGRPQKRRRKNRLNAFIDVEAVVDEDEEEEGDEDDEIQDETHPDDLVDLPAGGDRDDRRHRELDRRREMAESMDVEKVAAALKEKYRESRRAGPTDSVVLPQRLLLPSVDDPTIWGVRCKPGKEREVIYAIMKRFEERINTREPLAICSAFERGEGPMAGMIYVEARRQEDIITATENISFCYPRSKMILVPINEMPDLLRVQKTKNLEPGMYVRMKRPATYAGDLAQIEMVEANGINVTVRLVPRIDYGGADDPNGPENAKRKRAGMPGPRPPQRLFSETEARKRHGRFLSQASGLHRNQWIYRNDTYIDGFLVKDFRINYLQTEDVNPRLEEVTRFAANADDGTENLDLAALAASLKTGTAESYLPGDAVEIYQGEQRGVVGKAVSVRGDIVTIRVTDGELRGQMIEAPVKGLRKLFKDGDHVKVIGGKYQDEVGMVVKVRDDRVTLLTDSNNEEIEVFSKDLRAATDAVAPIGSSKYDLHELVQLDAATVGCVIKVDKESLRVLDQSGAVRTVLPSQIANKLERRRNAVATDREGSEVRHEDTVKEQGGESRQGRVMHIHRNYLFLLNRQIAENGGVFVVRSTNVTTVAAKGGLKTSAGPDLSKMNPAMMQRNGNGAAGGGPMAPPKTFGRDRMIGKTVTVRKGPYKGLLGIVKDTTDTSARVELHTKNKTITVPKDVLTVKDPITGGVLEMGKFGGKPRSGGTNMPSRFASTPSRGPSWNDSGSKTSAWSSNKTPAWMGASSGNKTPGWSRFVGDGSQTSYGGDGSRTAYGGDGSRTAYGDGNRTSYGGSTSYGGASTWNPSATTPYAPNAGYSDQYSGSKTPAYTPGGYSAPTPGASHDSGHSSSAWGSKPSAYQGAPTPGASYEAPTPGFSAPTPGDSGNHPTPRGYGGYGAPTPAAAPTPGAWGPETPAAWNAPETPAATGDDDPRYE